MEMVVFLTVVALSIFILLLWVFSNKRKRSTKSDTYACSECGLQDCICQKENDNSEQDVKIYSLSTCSHCKSVKKLLSECMIKYEFTDVDLLKGEERNAILEDVKKYNPRCSFPTVIIGDHVIVGYKEDEIKKALNL